MNKTLLFASLLALSGVSSVAAAADDNWFVRGEVGNGQLSVDGATENESAGSIRGGYYFNHIVGIEGFYTNYGSGTDDGVHHKIDGFGGGVVVKKDFGPNNNGFFIQGRAGVARVKAKVSIDGLGSASDSTTKGYIGFGAGYDFNSNFGLSLNYDYTGVDIFGETGHVNTWTGALEARF